MRNSYKIVSLGLMLMLLAPVVAQEEEGTTNPLAGYTLGLNVGYPVVAGETYEAGKGPIIGIAGNTPYGFALGPFNMGVGFSLEAALMKDNTQIGVVGTVNTTIFVTPYGPLSYWGGVGYYDGLGLAGGLYYDYMVPNMPLVVKPYMRALINTGGGSAGDELTGFVNIGVMAMYDISTFFNKSPE